MISAVKIKNALMIGKYCSVVKFSGYKYQEIDFHEERAKKNSEVVPLCECRPYAT